MVLKFEYLFLNDLVILFKMADMVLKEILPVFYELSISSVAFVG